MNQKMEEKINLFFNLIGLYMIQEYDPQYSEAFGNINTIYKMRDLVASYYMGGNTVQETAGIIVETLKKSGI